MSGGGGPTQTTVTQSNVPDWLRPQVETVLGGAMKELFQTKEVPGTAAVRDEYGNIIKEATPSTYAVQHHHAGLRVGLQSFAAAGASQCS